MNLQHLVLLLVVLAMLAGSMPGLVGAARIKTLKNQSAELLAEDEKLRRESATAFDAARTRADKKMTPEEKTADDQRRTRLEAITAERDALTEQIRSEELLADRERVAAGNTAVTSGVVAAVTRDPTRGFPTLGHFALEVMNAGPSVDGIRRNERLMAASGTPTMQVGVREDGGVAVPPAYSTQIWDGARVQSNSLLSYCDVNSIDPGVESVTVNAVNETSRADGSRWGGVRGYWKSELAQMTGTGPKFRDVKFAPQELYVFAYVSDKLLRQAPGFASGMISKGASDEIAFKTGDSIVNGDGLGKPRGFLGHASVVSIAKENAQVAATILKENIDKMWARCHANWRSGAVWFINQDCEPALEQLAAVVGTGGIPVYIPAGGVADTPNARLKGRPVIAIEYCATLGTVGDIVLANLKAYGVTPRGLVDSAVSMHLKFDFAQSAFRFIYEVDGQPWLASTITPYKGTNTLSPIVTLASR